MRLSSRAARSWSSRLWSAAHNASAETSHNDSRCVQADTYVLQEHLEGGLGFSYVLDVNGIKGHVKDKAAVDMTAVHALLDKFGFAYEEYEDAD